MKVAAARGRALGLTMQQAFGDLVGGAGARVGVDFGQFGHCMVDAEAVNAAYAASLARRRRR